MDSLEKKWFIYLGDHHEGPFSLNEILGMLSQGQISNKDYVWTEGMPDWKIMNEVEAFQTIPEPPATPTLQYKTNLISEAPTQINKFNLEDEQKTERQESQESTQVNPETSDPVEPKLENKPEPKFESKNQIDSSKTSQNDNSQMTSSYPWMKIAQPIAVVLILLGIAIAFFQGHFGVLLNSSFVTTNMRTLSESARPYLITLSEKFPFLESWISPIPTLEDITATEFEELKTAARGKPETSGVKFGLALSNLDSNTPSFYVSSNSPEEIHLVIYAVGHPDTLLNQTSFSAQIPLTIDQRIGKSIPLRALNGFAIPKGIYSIFLFPAENSPKVKNLLTNSQSIPLNSLRITQISTDFRINEKVLLYKKYFLGGPRDSNYFARLKDYHDKLRKKANDELIEAKQFAITLRNQLESTATFFSTVKKVRIPNKRRKQWEDFHSKWLVFQNNLERAFVNWTPENLKRDFFYDSIYHQIQQVGQDVTKVHGVQHSFFIESHDPRTFEIQFGEALSSAQNAINQLLFKIEQAEKIPPTPNGMPRKEGL